MDPKQARTADSVDSVVVTARVAPETHEALKAVAERNYRSVSSHLRSLIEADVAAQDYDAKEAA